MAPEVLSHGMLSREADVFSFGVVLWVGDEGRATGGVPHDHPACFPHCLEGLGGHECGSMIAPWCSMNVGFCRVLTAAVCCPLRARTQELFHAQRPPWRDPEVLAAATERLQAAAGGPARPGDRPARRIVPGAALAAVLGGAAPAQPPRALGPGMGSTSVPAQESDAGAGTSRSQPGGGGGGAGGDTVGGEDQGQGGTRDSTAVALPRPLLVLDPSAPHGFSYPLPPDCPPAYASLIAACLHPIPKVRDAVHVSKCCHAMGLAARLMCRCESVTLCC